MFVGRICCGLPLVFVLAGGCALHQSPVQRGPEAKFSDLPTIEKHDAPLANALAALSASPTTSAYLSVAEEYLRLRIFDEAHDHFKSALKIDSRHAAAYDGLARLWRDAGFPELSLTEASRAVYFAPRWAEAQNTLGTILYALGNTSEAERIFERARALDPGAAYVHSNLCYVSLVRGNLARAHDQCTEALRLAPELSTARANMAAVTAAVGK